MSMGFSSRHKDVPKYITELSRYQREVPTSQEEKLWQFTANKKMNGIKFRRQFPVGRYIVDFYNHDNKLIVEVDGEVHKKNKEYDQARDAYLTGCGYTVLRFTNKEVEQAIENVLQKITLHLE